MKIKNKINIFLILTFGLIFSSVISAQEKSALDTNKLLGSWTLNPVKLPKQQDTLEYIRYSSPLTLSTDPRPVIKSNGIRFEKNGGFEFIDATPRCGTEGVLISEETWTITNDKNFLILNIFRLEKKIKEYYIYSMNADKLILINKKQKTGKVL